MKKNICFCIVFIIITLQSCYTPHHVPKPAEVPTYNKGAHVVLYDRNFKNFSGELIAVDKENKSLFILKDYKQIEIIRWDDILSIKVQFARGRKLGWTIPAFSVLPFTHGWLAAFSIPINSVATIIISSLAHNDHTIRKRNLSLDDLNLFTRFPQGIPKTISLNEIK